MTLPTPDSATPDLQTSVIAPMPPASEVAVPTVAISTPPPSAIAKATPVLALSHTMETLATVTPLQDAPAPTMQDLAPERGSDPVPITHAALPSGAIQRIAPAARPPMPTLAAMADPFVCRDCTGPDPRYAGITITLLGGGTTQDTIAAQVGLLGPSAFTVMPSPIGVATSQVRFYRAADFDAAQALAQRFDAVLVDVSWLSDAAPAKIDLLLIETTSTN